MLVDYKDRVTGTVFEVFFKSRSEVQDTIVNAATGNLADKQFSAGTFKLVGAGFHCNDYPTSC